MKRIIIDLTEFNKWSGHLTGVQRVVYGVAKGFEEDGANDHELRYVTFDGKQGFKELAYEDFNSVVAPVQTQASQPAGDGGNSRKKRLKIVVKKVYYRTPRIVRNYFTPVRQEKVIRKAKAVYGRLKSLRTVGKQAGLRAQSAPFTFERGDIIVSAGRAWDDSRYVDALEQVKVSHGVKIAYVVYDLIPIYQQHTFGPGLTERYSRYLYRILKAGDYLFPISKATERDLKKFAAEIGIIHLPAIKTMRLGDDIPGAPASEKPAFIKNPAAFTMAVGTIEARKNHTELYYAYKLAAAEGVELPDLYIIGSPGWLTGDVLHFLQQDIQLKDKITILHNVSDDELAWMYKHALFSVYPSQYEGWGLPIAESIAFGTPCIASNTSSMIEIAPKFVTHVSPFDTRELFEQMRTHSDPKFSQAERARIESGYKLYSWTRTTATLLHVLESK